MSYVQYFQGEACGEAGAFGEKVSETCVHCEYLVTLCVSESRRTTLPSPPLPSQVAYLQSTAQQLKDLSKQVKSLPDPAKQAVKWFSEHAMKM